VPQVNISIAPTPAGGLSPGPVTEQVLVSDMAVAG